ncbi:MAG: hypothetical protein PHW10_03315 [Candidatus Peribacteraceae bacterium]|nr:hypothetical protein [Candidatus Peribacteraceae bacterium]
MPSASPLHADDGSLLFLSVAGAAIVVATVLMYAQSLSTPVILQAGLVSETRP